MLSSGWCFACYLPLSNHGCMPNMIRYGALFIKEALHIISLYLGVLLFLFLFFPQVQFQVSPAHWHQHFPNFLYFSILSFPSLLFQSPYLCSQVPGLAPKQSKPWGSRLHQCLRLHPPDLVERLHHGSGQSDEVQSTVRFHFSSKKRFTYSPHTQLCDWFLFALLSHTNCNANYKLLFSFHVTMSWE